MTCPGHRTSQACVTPEPEFINHCLFSSWSSDCQVPNDTESWRLVLLSALGLRSLLPTTLPTVDQARPVIKLKDEAKGLKTSMNRVPVLEGLREMPKPSHTVSQTGRRRQNSQVGAVMGCFSLGAAVQESPEERALPSVPRALGFLSGCSAQAPSSSLIVPQLVLTSFLSFLRPVASQRP